MTMTQWSDQMEVHIPSIDQQHRKLVALLNDLNQAIQEGENREMLGGAIAALADYAFYHFMTEENYFDRFEYPHAEQHKNEHRYFKEQVNEFQQQFDEGKPVRMDDIIRFLRSWILNHIQKSDQKYAPFLISRGLS